MAFITLAAHQQLLRRAPQQHAALGLPQNRLPKYDSNLGATQLEIIYVYIYVYIIDILYIIEIYIYGISRALRRLNSPLKGL